MKIKIYMFFTVTFRLVLILIGFCLTSYLIIDRQLGILYSLFLSKFRIYDLTEKPLKVEAWIWININNNYLFIKILLDTKNIALNTSLIGVAKILSTPWNFDSTISTSTNRYGKHWEE